MAWSLPQQMLLVILLAHPVVMMSPQLRVYREWCLLLGIGQIANPPTRTRHVITFSKLKLQSPGCDFIRVIFGTAEDSYRSNNMHLDSAVGTHLWKYARTEIANNWFRSVKPGQAYLRAADGSKWGSSFGRRLNGRSRGTGSGSDHCCLWSHQKETGNMQQGQKVKYAGVRAAKGS